VSHEMVTHVGDFLDARGEPVVMVFVVSKKPMLKPSLSLYKKTKTAWPEAIP